MDKDTCHTVSWIVQKIVAVLTGIRLLHAWRTGNGGATTPYCGTTLCYILNIFLTTTRQHFRFGPIIIKLQLNVVNCKIARIGFVEFCS